MRLLSSLVVLALLMTLLPAQADGPEDQYLVVYNLVDQADALSASGKSAPALAKYREAQSRIAEFPEDLPDVESQDSLVPGQLPG